MQISSNSLHCSEVSNCSKNSHMQHLTSKEHRLKFRKKIFTEKYSLHMFHCICFCITSVILMATLSSHVMFLHACVWFKGSLALGFISSLRQRGISQLFGGCVCNMHSILCSILFVFLLLASMFLVFLEKFLFQCFLFFTVFSFFLKI